MRRLHWLKLSYVSEWAALLNEGEPVNRGKKAGPSRIFNSFPAHIIKWKGWGIILEICKHCKFPKCRTRCCGGWTQYVPHNVYVQTVHCQWTITCIITWPKNISDTIDIDWTLITCAQTSPIWSQTAPSVHSVVKMPSFFFVCQLSF